MSYTQAQLELQAHIQAENAANENSCFSVTDNLEHWAESDVNTIAEYDHYMALENYINIYRDINNIKPRWEITALQSMSTAEIVAKTNAMITLENKWQDQQAAEDAQRKIDDAKDQKELAATLNVSEDDLQRWGVG